MSVEPVLQIDRLHVELNVRGEMRTVLHDVSLGIGRGESVGLVGESGSGKSMTARSIMRLLGPGARSTGSIFFEGDDVLTMSHAALLKFRRKGVAMIYQDPRAHINPVRTIGDFLTEGLLLDRNIEREQAEARVVQLLDEVGITDAKRR